MSFVCSHNNRMATWDNCTMPVIETRGWRMISNAIVRVINDGKRINS